jgi:hypothetical protein
MFIGTSQFALLSRRPIQVALAQMDGSYFLVAMDNDRMKQVDDDDDDDDDDFELVFLGDRRSRSKATSFTS